MKNSYILKQNPDYTEGSDLPQYIAQKVKIILISDVLNVLSQTPVKVELYTAQQQ